MSERKKDYTVGYRRPPKATQFKPGQSGHPNGRPRGAKSTRKIWDEEIRAKVLVHENGKSRLVSKLQVAVRQLMNKAAGGDLKAIAQIHMVLRELEAAAENPSSLGPGVFDRPADAQTMASIVERIRLSFLASREADGAAPASIAAPEDDPAAPPQDEASDSAAPETGAEIPDPKSPSKGDASC